MKIKLLKSMGNSGIFQRALLSLTVGFISTFTFAQNTFTVGTGTVATSNMPISSCYGFTYSQGIYGAGQLTSQGITGGTITKIRFYVTALPPNTATSNNWVVYLGHTNKTNFASTTDWEIAANLQQCFSGIVTFPAANNWMEITLTTPFVWNGVNNLIVGVEEEQSGYSCTGSFRGTTYGGNRGLYYRSDVTNPNINTPPVATGMQTTIPNVQFDIVSPDCSGTPVHSIASASAPTVCPNGNSNLSVNQYYFDNQLSFQWQVNTGASWENIDGATTKNYSLTGINETADYRLVTTCLASGEADTSDITSVLVNPVINVSLNTYNIAICNGDPAELIASGGVNYTWAPATGLSSTTFSDVMATPLTKTTYTVTGTSAEGCTATASVVVTPVSEVTGILNVDPFENCTAGSPVTFTVSSLVPEITSSGTWEYRWLDEDSASVLQDWNSTNSYTFIPPTDGVYELFYQIRSTSCPSDYVDSVFSNISIGFGADVDLIHYNCNTMGGTISLSDIYGQPTMEEIYANALSEAGTDILLTGNAAFNAGRIELTPSAASKSGSATITPPNFVSGMNNSLKFNFTITADMPINNFGTGGGDGLAFSFGNDAVITGVGPYQNGKGSKLRLVFDAANNAGGNVAGIYLTYGFNTVDMAPTSNGVLAYSNNVSIWKTQTDVPVEISIDLNSLVTVTVGGQVIFNGIQLPASYKNENVTLWKHLFTALTGGDALRHAVKDYSVSRNGVVFGIADGGSGTTPSEWQIATSFNELLPGSYDIWISKDETATCSRNIGTFEILNLNPIVDLGNDTTICQGETLILNAQNDGAIYTWSGTNAYTQTIEVSEEGTYMVSITDTVGCIAIGTINVAVTEAPSATGIYAQGFFPMMNITVLGVENTSSVDFDFGDGQTLSNAPTTVSHMYAEAGTYTITATLTNDCGTEVITETISVIDIASVDENEMVIAQVYPNPAVDFISIEMNSEGNTTAEVYSVSGAKMLSLEFNTSTKINTQNWESGIYFIHLTIEGKNTVSKVVVQ